MSAALSSVAPREDSCSLPLSSGRKDFQDPGALKSVMSPAGSHKKRARQIMRMFRKLTGHVSCLPSPVNAYLHIAHGCCCAAYLQDTDDPVLSMRTFPDGPCSLQRHSLAALTDAPIRGLARHRGAPHGSHGTHSLLAAAIVRPAVRRVRPSCMSSTGSCPWPLHAP